MRTDTKLIVTLVAAFLTLAGTFVTAYFGFLALTEPVKITIAATQTAAAQLTVAAQTSSIPVIATTIVPVYTAELTTIVITTVSTTPSVVPTVITEQGIGNWIISVGGVFKSPEAARDFVSEKPYSDYPAQVFQKDGFYRSVLVGFASEKYASEALRKIVDKGGRGDVRDLTNWCKNPVSHSGYTLCK